MSLVILGAKTTLSKASSKFESLRTTVPRSVVEQWHLKEHDKLDWSWEVIEGEMKLVVTKAKAGSKK